MKGKAIDPDTRNGISNALQRAFKLPLGPLERSPLLVDQAADAAFQNMIDRLRSPHGSLRGRKA